MENRVQHVIGVIDKVVRRPHTQRPACELLENRHGTLA
jgi:hypothetical protein